MPQRQNVPELLTQQFYDWEVRGRGWLVWPAPVDLEPPFRPFLGHHIPRLAIPDDGQFDTVLSRLVDSFFGVGKKVSPAIASQQDDVEEPEPEFIEDRGDLVELQIALPPDFDASNKIFEQCLFNLTFCKSAISFEIVGTKEGLVAQIVSDIRDAQQVYPQIKAHFPEAVLTPVQGFLREKWEQPNGSLSQIIEFGLNREFMVPLHSAKQMATDPLVGICGVLEYLGEGECGVFQVLFQPVRKRWAESVWRSVTTNGNEPFFENDPDMTKQARQKLACPLFSVVARAAAKSPHENRMWEIIKGFAGALTAFRNPAGNELIALENVDYPDDSHEFDLVHRVSRRSGMLLNSDELVSLAHLPTAAVRSRKLKHEIKRTKEPPAISTGEGVTIGENIHEGKSTRITLKPDQRVRHMHVIGGTGTGKSTLLLNLICQDIYQNRGIAVLDPHGDLIDQILGYIPPERYSDVILFDASDDLFPIGFNIISAHSDLEKNLMASDLVAVFQRLSTSWGDQMTSVLGNTILAFLESSKGGTLADVRRFLIEAAFRREFLPTVQDPEVVYYWEHEFPLLKSNSLGPLLTRLDTFLRPKTIRYVVGQKENKLDFGSIMNEGKIFLARLPQGLIGEENAYLLGTLLVSKFHQLTISRQQMEAKDRRPFFLYLDEFQHFVTPSMATILSGVRKYQLGLILAHHELRQLQKDSDVASAVLSHPYTRVCFRVGDEDARKLSEGFRFFETSDIQNLGTGEAICRMERADFDFNLQTTLPPEVDAEGAAQRRAYLQYISRVQYGTPRADVEEELAKSRVVSKKERVDPFAKRSASLKKERGSPDGRNQTESESEEVSRAAEAETQSASHDKEPPSPPPAPILKPREQKSPETRSPRRTISAPKDMGRGGPEHRRYQKQVKQVAEGLGWRSTIEKQVPGGSVDVALEKGELSVACEISVTTSAEHEVESLENRLRYGFDYVYVITREPAQMIKIRDAAHAKLDTQTADRVHFGGVEDLLGFLGQLGVEAPPGESTVRGYKVKTSYVALSEQEQDGKSRTVSDVVAKAFKRFRRKKRK